jgi:methionyl-tRNA formyltransferase
MNIIFMGTPDFALPALQKLVDSKDHNVAAVFTQRPKAKGRGMKLSNSPVHDLADSHNIPVHTPKTLRNNEALELINSIDADIIVVVAYGFIIPKNILEAKKYGCLNIHPSKLPKYRGAAPLQRTVINGEKETAICIMQMDEGLDTGDIILQKDLKLDDRITLPELHDKCAKIGGELLIEVLDNIDVLPRIKQSEEGLCYAHKLSKEEGKIDWSEDAFVIDCKIRGMNPWPGVYFEYDGKIVKIISATYTEKKHNFLSGKIIGKNCEVACGSGTLIIESLKPEGKKQMPAADFLRGIAKSLDEVVFV